MNDQLDIHRVVSDDGRTLHIEFLRGPTLWLTRDEACALLDVLQEQLPKMAVSLSAP